MDKMNTELLCLVSFKMNDVIFTDLGLVIILKQWVTFILFIYSLLMENLVFVTAVKLIRLKT